jgi:hypothetical protein
MDATALPGWSTGRIRRSLSGRTVVSSCVSSFLINPPFWSTNYLVLPRDADRQLGGIAFLVSAHLAFAATLRNSPLLSLRAQPFYRASGCG